MGDAAEERLVVALARGCDPELLELVVDQLVHVVVFGLGREREVQALGQHDELRADGVGLEAGHHEGLAALAGRDEPVDGDRGGDVVIRQEYGQAGHVSVAAVGVSGADRELLGRARAVEHALLGVEVHADDLGELGDVVIRRAALDPGVQRLVELAAGIEPLAAGVLHGTDRLLEQGAVGGDRQVDPTADHLAGEAMVVAFGVEAEQGDPESVLASCGAVAAPGIAAGPHEDRHHVEPEAERRNGRRLRDFHRHRDVPALVAHGQRRGAICGGIEDRPDALHEPGIGQGHRRVPGHIARDAVGEGRLDHDRLTVARGRQLDLGRIDGQAGQGRGVGRGEDLGGELGRRGTRGSSRRGEDRDQDEEHEDGLSLPEDRG